MKIWPTQMGEIDSLKRNKLAENGWNWKNIPLSEVIRAQKTNGCVVVTCYRSDVDVNFKHLVMDVQPGVSVAAGKGVRDEGEEELGQVSQNEEYKKKKPYGNLLFYPVCFKWCELKPGLVYARQELSH